jgi:hypothetical protein
MIHHLLQRQLLLQVEGQHLVVKRFPVDPSVVLQQVIL